MYRECSELKGGLIASYMLKDLEERVGNGDGADDSLMETPDKTQVRGRVAVEVGGWVCMGG